MYQVEKLTKSKLMEYESIIILLIKNLSCMQMNADKWDLGESSSSPALAFLTSSDSWFIWTFNESFFVEEVHASRSSIRGGRS